MTQTLPPPRKHPSFDRRLRVRRSAAIGAVLIAAAGVGTVVKLAEDAPVVRSELATALGRPDAPPGVGGAGSADGVDSADGGAGPRDAGSAATEQDGILPAGVSAYDEQYPGVAKLDAKLLAALRSATKQAADDGIELVINSGWRSPAYQQQLLDEAVIQYGSKEQAAAWVATPDTSPHVSGDAVDVGPTAAAAWLAQHGAALGLCQIYRNESWHFELRVGASSVGCPTMYADPTADPRMHKSGD